MLKSLRFRLPENRHCEPLGVAISQVVLVAQNKWGFSLNKEIATVLLCKTSQ